MIATTTDSYAGLISVRIAAERTALATRWLERLKELLSVPADAVFPSDRMLDHIPALIEEIAAYLRAPTADEIAANTAVMAKARELGTLRHQQQSSVHQLLREYEMLSEVLEGFVVDETRRLGLLPTFDECFEVQQRLTRSSRTLMRTTVDTFVGEYTAALQERNERITRFNQMASHELRSPIGTLLFAGTLLGSAPGQFNADPQRLSKLGATIRTNAERLSWLIDNLQRLTRLTDPLETLSEQLIDVETMTLEVARQLAEMAAARGVAVRIGSKLPTTVLDPARLELVLLNLVSNAIKYSDPRKPERFVEITSPEPAGADQAMVLCVRDNGLGIPEAARQDIFERFVRAHAEHDGELGVTGSGLGLSIVADCVQALGGSVRCESSVGDGTTFIVTLPGRPAVSPPG
ncbi:MAG: HAMP domain-containing sensor histidine kinase [Acidobacteriota bacterium]